VTLAAPSIRTDVHNLDIDIRKSAFVTSLDQAVKTAEFFQTGF
jgi:hypothetical protein